MPETRRELALIAVDLGLGERDGRGRKARWLPQLRRKEPDFCSLFAAEGVRQFEIYLANWAGYDDYLTAG